MHHFKLRNVLALCLIVTAELCMYVHWSLYLSKNYFKNGPLLSPLWLYYTAVVLMMLYIFFQQKVSGQMLLVAPHRTAGKLEPAAFVL